MPRDVNFSLANALTDFGATRRTEQKAAEPANGQSPEDTDARKASFGQFVSGEAHKTQAATPTRGRSETHRADRAAPKAKPAERPADKPAPEKDDAVRAEDGQGATEVASREGGCVGRAKSEPTETVGGEAEVSTTEKSAEATPAVPGEVTPAATQNTPEVAGLLDLLLDPALAEGATTVEAPATETTATLLGGAVPTTGTAATPETGLEGQKVGGAVNGILPAEASEVAKAVVGAIAAEKAAATAEGETAGPETGASEGTDAADLLVGRKPDDATGKSAAETVKKAGEGDSDATPKNAKAEPVEAVGNKSTTPNLHPTRAAHFVDMLEGFTGQSAIHRPADILAGLDRSIAATALNRGAEVSRPTPLQMLPIEIGMQAVRGVTNFQIRLDPAELGRVDVKLQIRENGEVNASLVVDRVETLQMLKRDASTLQYAFEQAGLKQSPDGLSFSLRGEGQQGQQQENRRQGGSADGLDEIALQAQIGDAAMRRVLIPHSSIDRMV